MQVAGYSYWNTHAPYVCGFWICMTWSLDLDLYIARTILAIFATELGEHNANENLYIKGIVCTVCHFTGRLYKNWLKHIFARTAFVWEAAPFSTLPTADENAVTESAVTTVSSSLFQPATVLTVFPVHSVSFFSPPLTWFIAGVIVNCFRCGPVV